MINKVSYRTRFVSMRNAPKTVYKPLFTRSNSVSITISDEARIKAYKANNEMISRLDEGTFNGLKSTIKAFGGR